MDSNTYNSERCVVCLEGTELLYFFTPCLHQCVCEACAVEYNSQQDEDNFSICPVCRGQYLSIEFDESKFLDLQRNRETADTAAQQLWTTFESNLQEMMLNLNGLKQDVSSAPSELQDRLSAAIQQIEELTLVTTQRSDPRTEEPSQPPQDIVVPGPSSASPRATTLNSVRDLVRVFEANDAVEDNAASSRCSRRTVVPLATSSGAVPRTTTTDAGSTRETEEDPDENYYPIPSTTLTDTQTHHLPVTVIQHETINVHLTNDEPTRNWNALIEGDISLRYPTNPLFAFDANLRGRTLRFRLHNDGHEVFTKIMGEYAYLCPFDETFPQLELPYLVTLIAKKIKQDQYASYMTSTLMKYWAHSTPQLDNEVYCPLDFTVNWNVQATLVTQLTIKYRYNPGAVGQQTTLHALQITVSMNAGFKDYEAEPMAKRIGDKLIWKLPSLTPEEADTYRTLNAEIHFSPSIFHPKGFIKANRKGKVSAQFAGHGKILSGIDFSLHGTEYTVQCTTKQFAADEYVCEGETVYS